MKTSIFAEPKSEWSKMLKVRSLQDLVHIDFPYALTTLQVDPVRHCVEKILTKNKKLGDPDVTPDLLTHLEFFFKKSDPGFSSKKWISLLPVFALFAPEPVIPSTSVLSEKQTVKIFAAWIENYKNASQAIEDVLFNTSKFDQVWEGLKGAMVRLIIRSDPVTDYSWLSSLSKTQKNLLSQKVSGFFLHEGLHWNVVKAPFVTSSLETHFPEFSEIVLKIAAEKIKKDMLTLEGEPLLDNTLQNASTAQQQANILFTLLSFGLKDPKEKTNQIHLARASLRETCLFVNDFYKENVNSFNSSRWNDLLDTLSPHDELFEIIPEIGFAAKSRVSKTGIQEKLTSLKTKTSPRRKF